MNEYIKPTVSATPDNQSYSMKQAEIESYIRRMNGTQTTTMSKKVEKQITQEQMDEIDRLFYSAYALMTKGFEYIEDFFDYIHDIGYSMDGLKHKYWKLERDWEEYRKSCELVAQIGKQETSKFITDFESFSRLVDVMLSSSSDNWNWELKAKYYETLVNKLDGEKEMLTNLLKGAKERLQEAVDLEDRTIDKACRWLTIYAPRFDDPDKMISAMRKNLIESKE